MKIKMQFLLIGIDGTYLFLDSNTDEGKYQIEIDKGRDLSDWENDFGVYEGPDGLVILDVVGNPNQSSMTWKKIELRQVTSHEAEKIRVQGSPWLV